MIRTLIFSIVVLLSISSCSYVDGFFKKEVKRIDFTSVDQYPVFPSCDSIKSADYIQKCFEETASEYIYTELLLHEFTSSVVISDALIIHINVDREGVVSFIKLEASAKTQKANAQLIEVVKESIDQFPTVIPATKRGVFVNSKYMIPLYIVK